MSEATKIKLNIGAGGSNLPGFIPIDMKTGGDALKLEYADNSVDEIYSSHCLEHIHHSKQLAAVAEWVRVLKPGGRIRVAVPDFVRIFEDYKAGKVSDDLLACWLHGTHDHDTDRHQSITTTERMMMILRRVAIDDIREFEPEYPDCSKLAYSLNLEGWKRNIAVPRDPVVAMVLSTPRIGFMDMVDGIAETARELGWHFCKWGGTEWGKGLTQAVLNAFEKTNADYIMCLDYDSVFTANDCRELLRLMQENPDVGAIYPVEAHRHGDLPLGFDVGGQITYRGELTQVLSGHFGCTIIRRQVFDSLPQPWFFSCPNPETGLWNQNNIDADLTFWALMGIHGWKSCQANNVQIGHMELCVKWLKPTGIVWQPIQHYRKRGKPPNAIFDGKYWEQFQTNRPKPTPEPEPKKEPENSPELSESLGTSKLPPIHPPYPHGELVAANGLHSPAGA